MRPPDVFFLYTFCLASYVFSFLRNLPACAEQQVSTFEIGFELGLFWVWGWFLGVKLALNWVCLGLFFFAIANYDVETHKIGFVLHIFVIFGRSF